MTVSTEIRDIPGVSIGHATNQVDRTGCTVVLFDAPVLTAADVRGAAPGTRELDLLAPGRLVQRADAILLTGGSAFGLRAADGVVTVLAERGRGFETPTGPVPIVPAAVLYDLATGNPVAPSVEDGRTAVLAARDIGSAGSGSIGAGTGATWGNVLGNPRPGGIGIAQIHARGMCVTAVVALNAFGVVTTGNDKIDPRTAALEHAPEYPAGQATTLISIIIDAATDHGALIRCCVAAHDGLARSIVPAHSMVDGDVVFASALDEGAVSRTHSMELSLMTELAVENAITLITKSGPELSDRC